MHGVTARDGEALLDLFESIGVDVWVDGGWGVDALLGKQTRIHADLDIVVSKHDVSALVEGLDIRKFKRIRTEDERPWNFVLGDAQGRKLDVHVISLDECGNGIYGPRGNGEMYPADSLTGWGVIHGRRVRCISAEWQMRFHTGYELGDNDRHDMAALTEGFGLELLSDPSSADDYKVGVMSKKAPSPTAHSLILCFMASSLPHRSLTHVSFLALCNCQLIGVTLPSGAYLM